MADDCRHVRMMIEACIGQCTQATSRHVLRRLRKAKGVRVTWRPVHPAWQVDIHLQRPVDHTTVRVRCRVDAVCGRSCAGATASGADDKDDHAASMYGMVASEGGNVWRGVRHGNRVVGRRVAIINVQQYVWRRERRPQRGRWRGGWRRRRGRRRWRGRGGGGEGSGLGGGVGGGGTGGGLGGGGLGGGRIISNVVKPGCSCVDESEHPIQMRWCSSGRRLRWVVQLKCVHVLLLVLLRKAQHSSWHTLEVVTLKCLKTRGHPTVPMSHIGHLRPGFASGP